MLGESGCIILAAGRASGNPKVIRVGRKIKSLNPQSVFAVVLTITVIGSWNARPAPVLGQEKEIRNPVAGDPKAIQLGKAYFEPVAAPAMELMRTGERRGRT